MWHQLLINGLIAGSALGLLAASFAIIYQTARFFHFAHASIYTLAAYLTYLFSRTLGLPFVVSIAASVSLTALAGWLLYVTTYLPIARRNASSTSLLLVSLGLMVALQNLIAMAFGAELQDLALPAGWQSDQYRKCSYYVGSSHEHCVFSGDPRRPRCAPQVYKDWFVATFRRRQR